MHHFPGSRLITPEWGVALSGFIGQTAPAAWELCYTSFTMDAKTPAKFHANCDAYSTTLTVVHNNGGTYNDGRMTHTSSGNKTFGGYAVGSWSRAACCAVASNECRDGFFPGEVGDCIDHSASADFVFGLYPGPPLHYPSTGNDDTYQYVDPRTWPKFGKYGDLWVGEDGQPGGNGDYPNSPYDAHCHPSSGQGTFQPLGTPWICGGMPWGRTDVEVWRPST
jgi:hypothetical protein